MKYRTLESCGSSKVTQAAQGAVVSHKSLSRRRWAPRHWHYKLQWVPVKKALALDRQTFTVKLTRGKCLLGQIWLFWSCLVLATGSHAHCIISCPLSVLCFPQWHRPAASRDRVFTVQREVRVTLIHLSNLQRIRQDKAWVSLKVQARPDKKFSSESTTPVALLTCNSPPRGHDFSWYTAKIHLLCLPSEGRSKL